jgi:hypothetical protein
MKYCDPLDVFFEKLQAKRQQAAGDCSLPLHTHTSHGLSNDQADMMCETTCEQPFTLTQPVGKLPTSIGSLGAIVTAPPEMPQAPVRASWLVAYRDRQGRLSGGSHDSQHGTVSSAQYGVSGWTFCLTDGHRISMKAIVSVAKTDEAGRVVAAWTVREHGLDGTKGQIN